MSIDKITFKDKSNTRPVADREKQVVADDLNQIKAVVNALITQINNALTQYSATTFIEMLLRVKDELKKTDVAIDADGTINMGAGIMSSLFTMTAPTDFKFVNAEVGKNFKALITGEYPSTWPDGVDVDTAFANYDGTKINIVTITPIQLGATPIYQVNNEAR